VGLQVGFQPDADRRTEVRPTKCRNCALHQFGGGKLITRLMRDDSQQMQRVGMLRLLMQYLAQQVLCLLQATLPLQLCRQRHRLRNRQWLTLGGSIGRFEGLAHARRRMVFICAYRATDARSLPRLMNCMQRYMAIGSQSTVCHNPDKP